MKELMEEVFLGVIHRSGLVTCPFKVLAFYWSVEMEAIKVFIHVFFLPFSIHLYGTSEENLCNYDNILSLVIVSFILIT